MKKLLLKLLPTLFILTGFNYVDSKTTNTSIIYCIAVVFSLLLLIGYCTIIKEKSIWFLLLFSSVLVVNIGYLALSLSSTLEIALLANRISYLGSVLLPICMLMNILNCTKIKYNKWLPANLLWIGLVVFIIAASPGYSTIYYKEVYLNINNGASSLEKVYGPLHCVYHFYLLAYLVAMLTIIIYSIIKKIITNVLHSLILFTAVFVNIGVWLLEQLVSINFEFLCISYIISELFLLFLYVILQENKKLKDMALTQQNPPHSRDSNIEKDIKDFDNIAQLNDNNAKKSIEPSQNINDEAIQHFRNSIPMLTPTEHQIFDCYVDGKSTKEIMQTLNIKENTLKYHNKNIYSKLGVSSRKQLISIYKSINK